MDEPSSRAGVPDRVGAPPVTLDPLRLQPRYSRFLQPGRILLTGHSHQAWPDVAADAVRACFEDAAVLVDDKWGRVFAQGAVVRGTIGRWIGVAPDQVALGASTHELVFRFLSALEPGRRHLVTTDGEFHTITRQLRRLAELGIEVSWVPALPVASLADRLVAAIRPDTAAVLASTVLFRTGHVVPGLAAVVSAAARAGAHCLLDTYHAFGVLPFDRAEFGPDPVFLVGGGYKYAQWGEGCCWLAVPDGCALRPVYTGWFADFAGLANAEVDGPVGYAADGAGRFAGSTFEPTSWYRAAAVCAFFDREGMNPTSLRTLSVHQTEFLRQRIGEAVPCLSPTAPEARGGFLAYRVAGAEAVVAGLRRRGIYVDARGDVVRLGPAPYLDDEALAVGAAHFIEVVREVGVGGARSGRDA